MKYASIVLFVAISSLLLGVISFFAVRTYAACSVHFDCPPGKAVSAACSNACSAECISTTKGCTVSCEGDCDGKSGGTGVNKGELPGGDDPSDGNNNPPSVCQLNPSASQCQNNNKQPSRPNQDNDGRCRILPNAPGCDSGPLYDNPGNSNKKDKEPPKKNISGRVWYDWDQNKNQNNGEPGIHNIRVESNPGNGNDRTNGNGDYDIKNQEQDRYTVKVQDGNAWKTTSKDNINVNLNQGNARNVDFGLFKGYRLEVTAFADLNANSKKSDNEPGIRGIHLDMYHRRLPGRINDDQTTNSQGQVTFNGSNNGNSYGGIPGGGSDYIITAYNFSPGFQVSGSNPFRVSINRTDNQDPPGEEIGLVPQWQIHGYVFFDINGDQKRDSATEPLFRQPNGSPPAISVTGISAENSAIQYTGNNNPFGNLILNNDGTFRVNRLIPGDYRITYQPPEGVEVNTTQYTLRVGDGLNPFSAFQCDRGNITPSIDTVDYCVANGAVAGNVINVAFAIADDGTGGPDGTPEPQASDPWIRSYGLDMRFDNRFINKVPQTACGGAYTSLPSTLSLSNLPSVLTPGVIVSGSAEELVDDLSPGTASPLEWNWTVQSLYSPPESEALPTSFDQVKANMLERGVEPNALVGTPGCLSANSCNPQPSLASGVYLVEGVDELTLTGWSVTAGKSILLLVDGAVYIDGEINVTDNTASFAMIVKGDIIVDPSVGRTAPSACPIDEDENEDNGEEDQGEDGDDQQDDDTDNQQEGIEHQSYPPLCDIFPNGTDCTDIEGLISTDGSFTIETTDNPATEKILNIAGSVVVNAGLDDGRFVNERDLGPKNNIYPVVNFQARPDILLNVSDVIKVSSLEYRELAP